MTINMNKSSKTYDAFAAKDIFSKAVVKSLRDPSGAIKHLIAELPSHEFFNLYGHEVFAVSFQHGLWMHFSHTGKRYWMITRLGQKALEIVFDQSKSGKQQLTFCLQEKPVQHISLNHMTKNEILCSKRGLRMLARMGEHTYRRAFGSIPMVNRAGRALPNIQIVPAQQDDVEFSRMNVLVQ